MNYFSEWLYNIVIKHRKMEYNTFDSRAKNEKIRPKKAYNKFLPLFVGYITSFERNYFE